MPNQKQEWRRNFKSLWAEFIPLSLSDVVMAIGDPFITSTLAHLPNSRATISGFGVAKAVAVLFESPIIMILHASNALAKNASSRRSLWVFTILLSGLLSIGLAIVSLPHIFS